MENKTHRLRLKFLGAAREVTGSKTLIRYRNLSFLVDFGSYQGPAELRNLNREDLPHPESYDGVILTHAHIDHSGLLPRLVKTGFRGPIFCTAATAALVRIMLVDAAHLEEEDAEYANRTGHSRHRPAVPLFNLEDVERTLKLIKILERDVWVELGTGLSVRLLRSGHLLGSSFVQFSFDTGAGTRLVTFSGDLGADRSPIIKGPVTIPESDYLVLESTYGDRVHQSQNIKKQLAQVINRVVSHQGVVVIPAFAVGRTQDLIYYINDLMDEKTIPELPLYVDSPMALKATAIYKHFTEELKLVEEGRRLETSLAESRFRAVETPEESRRLNQKEGPMIIISAAGMLTGGRILHHLKKRLPHRQNAVVIVGFQAPGTKGRLLQNGIDRLRIHHEEVEVNAEIVTIHGMSAHADSREILQWMRGFRKLPERIFLNHGDPEAMKALKYRLQNELGITEIELPRVGEEFVLE